MTQEHVAAAKFPPSVREDLLIFSTKVQIQQIDAPDEFNEVCVAAIVEIWNAGKLEIVPSGRGTLGNTVPEPHGRHLREIFRRGLQQYLHTFYQPAISEQFDFHLELFSDGSRQWQANRHAQSRRIVFGDGVLPRDDRLLEGGEY